MRNPNPATGPMTATAGPRTLRPRALLGAALLALTLLGLTLPRLAIDYGADGDAVLNAMGAERLATTGRYWPLRLPGSPLFDILLAAVVPWGGHLMANTLVLAFYVAAVAAFRRLANGLAHAGLLTLLFAATPLVLKNAATTMDYVPALAFLLTAWLALRRDRVLAAAILLGCAAGMRVSNVVFVLPAALFLWRRDDALWRAAGHTLVAGVLAAAFNWPLLAAWLTLRPEGPTPPPKSLATWALMAGYNALNLWGLVAVVALLLVAAHSLWRHRATLARRLWRDPACLAEATAVAAFAALFLLLPDEAEYLLPCVPFVYLLLGRTLPRATLVLLTLVVFAAAFVTFDMKGGTSGQRTITFRPAPGVLLRDYLRRREFQALRDGLIRLPCAEPAVVLTGASHALSYDNPHVTSVPVAAYPALREGLRYAAGDPPQHRVTDRIEKLAGREVFFAVSLPRHVCEELRRRGYRLYLFSAYAPAYAFRLHRYDPYALGLERIVVDGPDAFYKTGGESRDPPPRRGARRRGLN